MFFLLQIVKMFFAGGSGALFIRELTVITLLCDVIGIIDIFIKLFVSTRTYGYNKQVNLRFKHDV